MRIRLEAREAPHPAALLAAPFAAILASVVMAALLLWLAGRPPGPVLWQLLIEPLADPYSRGELLVKAAPIAICATGLAIGFRAGIWNIGAEGQLLMGATAAMAVAMIAPADAGLWLLPAVLMAGIAGGMAWGSLPALLRTRFAANEILTSLMLTYVATLLLAWLVRGPMRDPMGFGFPGSPPVPDAAMLPLLLDGSRLHAGLLLAVAVLAAGWLLISRSRLGFRLDLLGAAPKAAAYAGFRENRAVWIAFLTGGGLAGLAGAGELAGPVGQLVPSLSPGYGFTAIIAAQLGRLHPIGIAPASLLLALTFIGGEHAQMTAGLPLAAAEAFQGLLLLSALAADAAARLRLRVVAPRTA